jgi:type IV secretion system protein VirD4
MSNVHGPEVTPPGYVLPKKPRWGGGWNLGAVFGGLLAFTLLSGIGTQWIADKLHQPLELGKPLFFAFHTFFYNPFGVFKLWSHYTGLRTLPGNVRLVLWQGFAIAILAGGFVGWFVYYLISILRDRGATRHNENLHGSARWIERSEMQESGLLTAEDGVYIGGWKDPKTGYLHFLLHNGPESVLLFAPSRSGKGISCVIPTLLQWKQSIFVYDLKGENFDITAGWRAKQGQRILRFAPSIPEESCCFNPLAEIPFGTDHDVSAATRIAEAVIRNGEETPYKHFEDAAVDLVTAGILHLGYLRRKEGKNTVTLPDVLALYSSPGVEITALLKQMQQTDHDPGGRSNPVMGWFDTTGLPTATHPYVAKAVQRQMNRADREGSGVQSSIVTPMSIYDDPLVQKTVCRSDFSILDLVYGEEPVSLYFKVPQPERNRLRPLVRLLLELIFDRLTLRCDPSRRQILLMLDEFPELKRMPNLSSNLSVMAGYNIRAFLVTQTLTQILEEYGEHESITQHCQIQSAFQTTDMNTADLMSKRCGNMTVERETVNYSGQRTDLVLKHVFKSVDQVQRPLITPDEVTRIKAPKRESNDPNGRIVEPGDMLIYKAGMPPIYGTQSLYFLSDTFRKRAAIPPPVLPGAAAVRNPYSPAFTPASLVHEAFHHKESVSA